jgi:LL-diaminopimelate aminotransferase
MIKKVVLDKADRLYHFPFDLEDFFPKRTIRGTEGRLPIIDLGHFRWPGEETNISATGNSRKMAGPEDISRLKAALAGWLKNEYRLEIDPRREIYIGHGIRRILFDFCLAFVEHGDIVLCPEPGLPFYRRHTISAGGIPVFYQMNERTGFKPSLKQLSVNLGKTAKILILNNPQNPLGTVLDETDLEGLIRIASKTNLFIINDAAYCSLSEERYASILSIPGGDKVAIEIFSFPFTFGLPYLPFGFAVGSSEAISGLETIAKTTGVFIPQAWVEGTLRAMAEFPSSELKNIRKNISQARLAAKEMAEQMGWRIVGSDSSPFLWLKIPERRLAASFAGTLLRRRKILTLPGNALGESGEGYIRLSLTAPAVDFRAAGERNSRRMILRRKREE